MTLARIDVTWARDAADGVSFKRSKGQRAQRARVVLYMYIVDFGDIQAGKRKKKGGICNFHYNWKFREHIFFDADTRNFFLHVHAVCLLFRHTAMSYLRSLSSKSIASGLTRSSFSECVNLSHLFLECLRQKNKKKIEYADVKQKRTRKLCLHMDLTHIVAPFLCIEATSSVTNTPGGDIDPWHNIRLNNQFGGWVSYHDRNS